MQKFLSLLLAAILVVPCFAGGGWIDEDPNLPLLDSSPIKQSPPKKVVQPPKIEKPRTGTLLAHRIIPKKGFFAGIDGIYPCIGDLTDAYAITFGYTRLSADQQGLIKATWNFYRSMDKASDVYAGIALFPGSSALKFGIPIGVSRYIIDQLQIFGDIYLYQGANGGGNIGVPAIGGRIIF